MENFQLLHVAVNFDGIEANIWNYTENSFFPRILTQKNLEIVHNHMTLYQKFLLPKARILMQKLQKL